MTDDKLEMAERWRDMIKLTRRLQWQACHAGPIASSVSTATAREPINKHVWEATADLRFMVWVGRSGLDGGGDSVFDIGPHTVKMSCDLWIGEANVKITGSGLLVGKEEPRYESAMLVCPPGHGKTQLTTHLLARRILDNPNVQAITGHAQQDQAIKNLEFSKACLRTDNPSGRRALAMYPKAQLSTRDNRRGTIQVKTTRKLRQQTAVAHGTSAAISGSDATLMILDDPVDQAEANSETERNAKYDRLSGTWFTRCRGDKSFRIIVTTLWHEDDANCRLIRSAVEGNEAMVVSIQGCGGPENGFKPLHATLASSARLRGHYNRNRHIYACAYQSNPSKTTRKIIDKVRFYDPKHDQHASFMLRAETHLTCDPSATNSEKSDKAGVVWAAAGEVAWRQEDESGRMFQYTERRCRVLFANEIRANQNELARVVIEFVKGHHVDEVHIETRGGYHATADLIEEESNVNCIRHDPGQKSKEIRLQRVASLIDDSQGDYGGVRAVLEFPGVYNEDGELVCNPDYQWLVDQFLKFGTIKADHCVDALTQLLPGLDLRPGAGPDGLDATTKPKTVLDEGLRMMNQEIERGLSIKRGEAAAEDLDLITGGGMWG